MVIISGKRIILFSVILIVSFYTGFQWGRSHSECMIPVSKTTTAHVAARERKVHCKPRVSDLTPVAPMKVTTCPIPAAEHLKLNENNGKSAVDEIFNALHHPGPIKGLNTEIIVSSNSLHYSNLSSCSEIYLTRSGSRSSMPNKCVAVVTATASDVSPVKISHRIGVQAGLTNRYAGDMHADHTDKHEMPQAFMQDRLLLVEQFKRIMGDPIDSKTGERRIALVMLANSGMLDLIINFMCSARSANIDLKDVIIFVGDQQSADIITNLGLTYFMHPSAGAMPKKAAGFYGDNVFTYMMWLKVTSVYIAMAAGFDVLFQVNSCFDRNPILYYFCDINKVL